MRMCREQNHLQIHHPSSYYHVSNTHTQIKTPTFTSHTSSPKPLKPSTHQSLSWTCLFMAFNEQHGPKVEARKQTWHMGVCPCACWEENITIWGLPEERKWERNLPICALHPPSIQSYTFFSRLAVVSQIALKIRAALLVAFQPAFTKPWQEWHVRDLTNFFRQGLCWWPILINAMAPMEEKKKYLPVQERVVRMMHYWNRAPSQILNN